jgi:predicted component of type VI protein secretion system
MAHPNPPPTAEPLAGELIVRNGPDCGVSRSLLVPVTLIGSGEACDLRILDLTVRPVHCAVSVTPEGPHLRSVGGTTPVNGVPSSGQLLQTGDIVTVGPVDLEVHWRLPPGPAPNSAAISVLDDPDPPLPDHLVGDRAA